MAVSLRSALAVAAACVLTSCTGWQSSFNAQAAQSAEIKRILLIFIAVSGVVWVGVMLVLLFGLVRRKLPRELPLDLQAPLSAAPEPSLSLLELPRRSPCWPCQS